METVGKKSTKKLNEAAQMMGRLGGLKTKQKYGNDYMKKLSKKAVKKRRELSTARAKTAFDDNRAVG